VAHNDWKFPKRTELDDRRWGFFILFADVRVAKLRSASAQAVVRLNAGKQTRDAKVALVENGTDSIHRAAACDSSS
jgi:hypothetical protein